MACINNRWTKRALGSAGFGYPSPGNMGGGGTAEEGATTHRWKPIFSVADIGGRDSAATAAELAENEKTLRRLRSLDIENPPTGGYKDSTTIQQHDPSTISGNNSNSDDLEHTLNTSKAYGGASSKGGGDDARVTTTKIAVVHGLNRPLFHIDLTSALQSAVANARRKGGGPEGGNGDVGTKLA